MNQRDIDRYDVVQQAAKATTPRKLKEARKDLIAFDKQYGHDPLVQKMGEQVEAMARNWKGK